MSKQKPWERARLEYKGCKVFDDGYAGRRYVESINGKNVTCCLGATEEPTEWASICEECFECKKYIENIIKGAEND